jgi:methyl-accepting chemotaxis protein
VAYFERALALLATLPESLDRGAAISYIGLQSLIASASWVGHTHEVMTNAHHIAKTMVDMETGQRGFMITGNDDFLEPYNAGKRDFDEVLQTTIGLVHDNPAQVRRLEVVRQKQREWLRVAGEYEIKLRRRADRGEISSASLAHVLQGKAEDGQPILGGKKTGKQLMDEIRVVIDEIVAVERDLLAQRKRENESAAIFSQNVAVYGSSLGLGE